MLFLSKENVLHLKKDRIMNASQVNKSWSIYVEPSRNITISIGILNEYANRKTVRSTVTANRVSEGVWK